MCASARKTPLDRRLKELAREAQQVRSDIKALNKALQKPDRLAAVPRSISLQKIEEAVAPPSRGDPVARGAEPEAAAPPVPAGELFAWRPPVPWRDKGRNTPDAPSPRASRVTEPTPKAGHLLQDDRFTNYFSSGSFVGTRPSKGEGRVQRNKAIFMIVVVVVFGFILYSLIF